MSKYYTSLELTELVESVMRRKMNNNEKKLFSDKVAYFENPRHGYHVYKDEFEILSFLSSGDYFIAPFAGGRGFCAKHGGGCFGYIDDDLLDTMIRKNMITEKGHILTDGFIELGKHYGSLSIETKV